MATLQQTTEATKKILKWAGIAIVVIIALRYIIFPLGTVLFHSIFPKKPPPPTEAFGKIPEISFPGKSPGNLTFVVKTTTGALPVMPDRALVYKFGEKQASFSSLDVAKSKVKTIGFMDDPTALSDNSYQWNDPKVTGRKIDFDIISFSFTLTSPIPSSTTDITDPPPAKGQTVTIAKNFLSKMSLLPSDLDDAKTTATLLKIKDGQLTQASSLSESDYMLLELHRKSVNELPIVNPVPLISFLIRTDNQSQNQVAQADYSYKTLAKDDPSTYPIKSSQVALSDLEQGKGYIVKNLGNQSQIQILKVYLAYYEADDKLNFLVPVYVFEGDNFQAIVSALL